MLESALHATLLVVDDHRREHALPYEERLAPADDWRIPAPADEAVSGAENVLRSLDAPTEAALRSATVYVPLRVLEPRPVLLLECEDGSSARPLVRWIVREGGRQARRIGLELQLVTSRLAEDSWRNGLHCYAIVGAGRCLLGEELAGRIRLPSRQWARELAHYGGFWGATSIRRTLLGHRNTRRDDSWPLRLAAERRVAAGEPPLLDPQALMRETPELAALGSHDPPVLAALEDAEWARVGLEIWRGWPRVQGAV